MACGNSYYEDNPAKDKLRDETAAAKNRKAAAKISEFFEIHTGLCCVVNPAPGVGTQPTKAALCVTEVGLRINHRGHEICVSCDNPPEIATQFRDWLGDHMTHITKLEMIPA